MPIGEWKFPGTGLSSRLQATDAGRREIAGDPADPNAVGSVWRHFDVERDVAEPGVARIFLPNRRIRRQFDDAFVVLADA